MTRALGISVAVARRPSATVAVLDGPLGSLSVVELFPVTTAATDAAGQAHDIAYAIRNRLHGLAPDAVLVRRADHPPRPSNQEGPRLRLLVEGACASAAKDMVGNTVLLTGRDAALLAGMSKDDLDRLAGTLVEDKFIKAAAAAIAALN